MVCKGAQPSTGPPAQSHRQRKMAHLQDVPFPQVKRQNISPIIGTNVPEAFVPLDVCRENPNDPIAIRSCLGFAVLSRTGDGTTQQSHDVYHIHTTTDGTSLDRQVEHFWKTNLLNGLVTTRSPSWVTITTWVVFGNMILLTCPSTARWPKQDFITSSNAYKETKTCMENTV